MELLTARIAVEKTSYGFDKLYSYSVPAVLAAQVRPGVRVTVPFGTGNQKRLGIVFETTVQRADQKDYEMLKPVASVVDGQVILNGELMQIVKWLKENTFCTYYEAARCVLPASMDVQVSSVYLLREDAQPTQPLTVAENAFVEALAAAKPSQRAKLLRTGGDAAKEQLLQTLFHKSVLTRVEQVKQKVGDETVLMVRLTQEFLDDATAFTLTPKQRVVTEMLEQAQSASLREVCESCGVGDGVVKNLVKAGAAVIYPAQQYRTPHSDIQEKESVEDIILSTEQQRVFDGIAGMLEEGRAQVALLRGVTGSGKTSVFLKLIHRVLAQGKQAMMLIPEISLTPQMVTRFRTLFGDRVAVMHSALSLGQRLDEWKRIQSGQAQIVVGTRSAVFAPCQNIGLIIMDEEGENSYKSESVPRYHAREVAKLRCVHHKAVLLLASATPSVCSYYYAKKGRYRLFELLDRYSGSELPQVAIVDMREELRNGNKSSISGILGEEILYNLEHGEQTLLLINRRGYHTLVTCLECGEAVSCPHCSVALTYHKAGDRMICHYCGYERPLPQSCPKCGSTYLKRLGAGTQRIQDEVQEQFPQARILRMDTDTTYSRFAYEENFARFAQGEYDIMLGTQMIAKGLDFPNVTLVGVLAIDGFLYSGDFKSYERAFSLMTQVVGRGGRGDKAGRAFIQTMIPDHEVINLAGLQDYGRFYAGEEELRRALLYPPFCDICVLGFSSLSESGAVSASQRFLALLREAVEQSKEKIPLRVLGPAPYTVAKVSDRFRYRLIVKCRNNATFRGILSGLLRKVYASREKCFSGVTISVDLNGEVSL